MRARLIIAGFAAVMVPASAAAAPATVSKAEASGAEAKPAKVDPAKAIAAMTAFLDKLFPAGPAPDPARLAAAQVIAARMVPPGSYAEGMDRLVDSTIERVLDMSEADLMAMFPASPPKKGEKPKVPGTRPLRAELAAKDPHFDAKIAAGRAFAKTMFVKFGAVLEPGFRNGMARSLARKFDGPALAQIDAFLATPTGAAYGRQMVGLWFEPDVMRGSIAALPELMKIMPGAAKDAAAVAGDAKKNPEASPSRP